MVVGSMRSEIRKELGENEHEADWIISHVTKMTQEDFIKNPREITDEEVEKIREIVDRRNSGEPLQYILGETEFMGMRFIVNEFTLIPRQDTETLVETVVNKIKDKKVRVLDIGTGSGCIGISIAKLCKNAEVTLLDYSDAILDVAKANAEINDVKVNIERCDILEEIPEGEFDVIVSNPPYIKSADIKTLQKEVQLEPRLALDGGEDGYDFYREIVNRWSRKLKKGGALAFELGEDQADYVAELLQNEGFSNLKTAYDLSGIKRAIIGIRF